MNNKEMQQRSDLLSQISALKASIKGLKLSGNKDYNDLIKGNEAALKVVEAKLVDLDKEVKERRLKDVERQQKERQKAIKNDIKTLNEFLAHVSKLKMGEKPDPKMVDAYHKIKGFPHVIHELRLRHLR